MATLRCDAPSGDVTGVTSNDVRGAGEQHSWSGSQIKRVLNQLSIMLKLGRITRFDTYNHSSALLIFCILINTKFSCLRTLLLFFLCEKHDLNEVINFVNDASRKQYSVSNMNMASSPHMVR